MRFVLIFMVILFAAAGAVFGALNSASVAYDFYFATPLLPKGAALLIALLLGWLLGGLLVYLGLVLRLRRRVRAQARELSRLHRDGIETDARESGVASEAVGSVVRRA
jgi:lipopolysaccharide assembly protein A